MSDSVIIVGGGLGGLSAAAALAQRGYNVKLIEKEPHVGGYAIEVHRGKRSYDIALHATAAGGAGQEFHRTATALGIAEDIAFIKLREGFRVCLGDYAFQMPNDYVALFAALVQEFPEERSGLQTFRGDLEKHANAYAPLFDGAVSKWRSVPSFIPMLPAFLGHSNMPTLAYLERFVSDPRLRAILFQPSIFMGIPMDEFPAVNFIMMFHVLIRQGMYTIRGGGQAVTDALTRRLQEHGGEVITSQKAERILIENGRATGVQTADGTTHRAAAVVTGVSTTETVRLVGASHFPPTFLRNLEPLQPSLSLLVLNLWLDCNAAEVGIGNHITVSFPSADIDTHIKTQREGSFIDGFSITAHGISEPESQSPDRAALSIIGGTHAATWIDLPDDEYRQLKAQATEDIIMKVRKRFPAISGHITFTDLATPRTLKRYTGNPGGAIMGFQCACGQHRQIMTAGNLPIKGLVAASAWTGKLGGFMQAMKAGCSAADTIAKGARL